MEFAIQPSELLADGNGGVFSTSEVLWDVTREKRVRYWSRTGTAWSLIDDRGTSWSDDDRLDHEEDNNPWNGNGHLYGYDEPGWAGQNDGLVSKLNMREWVRVGLGGASARSGVRCSDYMLWHSFRGITRVNGVWANDANYENEIVVGNVFWGNVPLP